MLVARPVAVFLCLAPFRFSWREKTFISWVGLRGAVGIFLASIPLLVKLPKARALFRHRLRGRADLAHDPGLEHRLGGAAPAHRTAADRSAAAPVELDLPGQLAQEIVGYPLAANSPYLRRGLLPSWARPTLVVRDEKILSPAEADPVRQGDYVYLLAPPEKAQALDRFFVHMPSPAKPDPHLLGDFFVTGDHTLGELAEIYGLKVSPEETATTLADYFATELKHPPRQSEVLQLGPIALVDNKVVDGRVSSVGLRLPEEDEPAPTVWGRLKIIGRRLLARLG